MSPWLHRTVADTRLLKIRMDPEMRLRYRDLDRNDDRNYGPTRPGLEPEVPGTTGVTMTDVQPGNPVLVNPGPWTPTERNVTERVPPGIVMRRAG